jgi:hypothetical protein
MESRGFFPRGRSSRNVTLSFHFHPIGIESEKRLEPYLHKKAKGQSERQYQSFAFTFMKPIKYNKLVWKIFIGREKFLYKYEQINTQFSIRHAKWHADEML